MNSSRQGFLFRFRWQKLFARLESKSKQQAVLLEAIMLYATNAPTKKAEKLMDEKTQICWDIIKDDLQQDMDAYQKKCEQNRANASKKQTVAVATERKRSQPNGSEAERADSFASEPVFYSFDKERDKDREIEKDKEYERDRDVEQFSLSQKKFLKKFPGKVESEPTPLPSNFDLQKLLDKVSESEFLAKCANLSFGWCILHYDEILANKYKNFQKAQGDNTKINKREYTTDEADAIFDNFNNLDL